MTRDQNRPREYYSEWIEFTTNSLQRRSGKAETLPYVPGRLEAGHDLVLYALQLCIYQYSRGDRIEDVRPNVWRWVEMKELQSRINGSMSAEFHNEVAMYERVTLDTVYDALTMMAFYKALHFTPDETMRLIEAIGHAGEDALIDEAARELGDTARPIDAICKYPKFYEQLLVVWRSDPTDRASKLVTYAKSWKKKMRPIYWSNNLNGGEGAYFGYWAFDVALIAILLDIEDRALRKNQYYPVDLVDAARGYPTVLSRELGALAARSSY